VSTLEDELTQLLNCADVTTLPRAYGGVIGQADYRTTCEDFKVSEIGVTPSGEGEHLLLRIRKTGQNTRWVAKRLADAVGLPYRAVSYAGLKDRHAVADQWFCLQLPGHPDPDLGKIEIDGVEVLLAARHSRKLRPGQLRYNEFQLSLRNCAIHDTHALANRLEQLSCKGVPNYFGPQRFGRDSGNLKILSRAPDLSALKREERAFALSALRGALFNGYLAARVAAGDWDASLAGEICISAEPRGFPEADEQLFRAERYPTGLLWGVSNAGNKSAGANQAEEREQEWFSRFPLVCSALEKAGSKLSRRVLVSQVANLEWQHNDTVLDLSFALRSGSYATVVLGEVLKLQDMALPVAADKVAPNKY
jgi:tRNA pseudouridine13 synthase